MVAPRSLGTLAAVRRLAPAYHPLVYADNPRELVTALRGEPVLGVLCGVARGDAAPLDLLEMLRAEGDRTPFALLLHEGDVAARRRGLRCAACQVLAFADLEATVLERLIADWSGPVAPHGAALAWRTDATGDFCDFSPAWSALTGRPPEKDRGRGWFELVFPEDRASFEERISGELARGRQWSLDARLRDGGGNYR